MKYRAEIDGLRALAVVPVILFHAGFELFSGGFVGVDVFFVISGYLITTILIEDMEHQRFSIVNFYERRARRILPALFFVMLACIPFAWMWMLPGQMKDFAQSFVAVSFFASNILFWRESGYFDAAAEEKPLLHTWSLAVEEQYYVLFPVFLILAWRFGKNRVFWMIVVMATISLLLSEWGWRNKATANFYLAPTRAWELFAGSIAAFIVQKQGVQKNNPLALLGLAAIVFSIFAYDESTPFPSVYALVPVLGVVLLVLYADKDTLAAKILSAKVFVGIGLISYSAYLWHQPLFAFARISTANTAHLYVFGVLSVLSIVLAYLSWLFVEKPFRHNKNVSRNYIFLFGSLGMLFFFSVGLLGHINGGFGNRFTEEQLALIQPRTGDSSGCHNGLDTEDILDGKNCIVVSDDNFSLQTAVIGDSHASSITDSLKDDLGAVENGFYAFNGSWCAPLMNFSTNVQGKNGCVGEINAAYNQILGNQEIKDVVLFAEWANYDLGYRWGDKSIAAYLFSDTGYFDWEKADIANNIREFELAVDYTFSRLFDNQKNVVVVLSVPEYEFIVPNKLNPKLPFKGNETYSLSVKDYFSRNEKTREVLSRYASKYGFKIVDPVSVFCKEGFCASNDGSHAYYEDANHLSYKGSSLLTPFILNALGYESVIQNLATVERD